MPKSLHVQLHELAAAEGVSLNQFIVSVLARAAGDASRRDRSTDAAFDQAQLDLLSERVEELERDSEIWSEAAERLDDLEDQWIMDKTSKGLEGLWRGFTRSYPDDPEPKKAREKRIIQRFLDRHAEEPE